MRKPVICLLATLDSKADAIRFMRQALCDAGARPWIVDLSLRAHGHDFADVDSAAIAAAAGLGLDELRGLVRADATQRVAEGGAAVVRAKLGRGEIDGLIGLGGANGSTMACAIMRQLPLGLPKIMVTPVAATAAVQWYVGESDIAMFPTIGDILVNRVTGTAMRNAANAVVGMAVGRGTRPAGDAPALIGVSSFGNIQPAVDRITGKLQAEGYEVIHFHASGPGGRALESLAARGELAAVIDLTTSELTDFITGGVYSAGEGRLRSAGAAGIPQVVVPGCLDFTNLWAGDVPDRYGARTFVRYNAEILLMRTVADEFVALGELMGERLAVAKGPVTVLIPLHGMSAMTSCRMTDIAGNDAGPWAQPEVDRLFLDTLALRFTGDIRRLPLHINDEAFADACVDALKALLPSRG